MKVIEKSPRILVLSGWYPSVLEPSNGDFVKEQVRILRREDLAIDLVFADLNVAYLSKFQLGNCESISIDNNQNKSIIYSGPFWPKNTSWGLKKWVLAYVSYVRKYIVQYGTPDLIHAHTYLGAMVAFELQKDFSIPYIVTEHYTGWMDGSIRKHHRKSGISALNGAKKILAVSGALKEAMEQWIKPKIEVVPNFIDFEIFKPDPSRKSDVFEILGVGDLIPRKQWDHLIKAYAAIHKDLGASRLTILGEGPLRGKLEGLIKSLKMQSHIELAGRRSKHEVANTMQRSSILVHTSHTETFGIIYLEALACGLPVISYDNGGVREFRDIKGVEILGETTINHLSKDIQKIKSNSTRINNDQVKKLFDPYQSMKNLYAASIIC